MFYYIPADYVGRDYTKFADAVVVEEISSSRSSSSSSSSSSGILNIFDKLNVNLSNEQLQSLDSIFNQNVDNNDSEGELSDGSGDS